MPKAAPKRRRRPRPLGSARARTVLSSSRRLVALLVLMTLALFLIGARLVDVQAVAAARYKAAGLKERVRTVNLAAERGSIFDRNLNDLALSVPQHTVYADPRVIKDPATAAARLAPVVGVDQGDLRDRLALHEQAFVYVARKVDDATVAKVRALKIPGVGFVAESKRFYPGGDLAAPVLGFVGIDNQGLAGLEHQYGSTLRGKPGQVVTEEDPQGRTIPATERREVAARRGGDLVLTLDQSLQYEVERQLTAQVEKAKAKGGMVVVTDITTGDVLAMATAVGATPTVPAHPARASDQNLPLTAVYEPGSTNKVITVASALEQGAITENTTLAVPSSLKIADALFEDHAPHAPTLTVKDIMRESSNVGAIEIARLVGKDKLDQYLRAFGFGTPTAIHFAGESAGILLDPADYTDTSMGSVPVGNGLAVTAMQMLDVFATVANGGVSRPPRLVAASIDANGVRHDRPPAPGHRVVSPTTAAALNDMLRAVVSNGTGVLAAVPGYTVAGKTGTARKPPYALPYRYMASFAGFAPAESPRLAAIVVLDEPGTSYYGGDVAAPLFATIMADALRLERVRPTTSMVLSPRRTLPSVSNDASVPRTAPSGYGSTSAPGGATGNVAAPNP